MAEEPNYSKRELDHFLGDLKNHLKRQDEVLARIETQVLKTNGRVTALEFWQGSVKWAWGVIVTILVFLANKFL